MQIQDTFATKIQERIEPVVKVADRRPAVLLNELQNLVVTPQWEQYLHRVLDAYTDAASRDDEQGIGIWISGFFGSGKSLLMKVLGILLEGGDLQGQEVQQIFLDRLPPSGPDRAALQRFLTICQRKITTTAVGGNLHALLASSDDPLALVTFKLFATHQGYTHNWPLAWAVEYQIDARGLSTAFHQEASNRAGVPWDEVAADPEYYIEQLYEAAAAVLPDHFGGGVAAVGQTVASAAQNGITTNALIDRLRRWCTARDGGGHRHKLLLQLDELGQWLGSGNANERTMQVQALAETAAQAGEGRIWIVVTAHGDVQELRQNVQQEYYAKINQRFAIQCKLSNDDISQVVEERVLQKTQTARSRLKALFNERSGELTDLGTVQEAKRVYPMPDAERFALFYPYMPWTVAVIPDVVKGIAQAAGREEALTGSNRTMIGVVQGAIIETPGLLTSPVGRLLSLADLYDQLASDVPIETKTDLNRVRDSVPNATPFTTRVARALFLLGQAEYIPTSLDNLVRALVDAEEAHLAALRKPVREELARLVEAGYAKQVGDAYSFLSTQQRTFQEKVRARMEELLAQTYELIQALKEYDGEDALRFEQVPLQGREIPLKLELDGRVARNPTVPVTVRVFSPLQRILDPPILDDAILKQRSLQEPHTILFRLNDQPELRRALALAVATNEVADRVISAGQSSGPEIDVARQAKNTDLASHKAEVRRLLGLAVRGGMIFFRGSSYQLAAGESGRAMVRATLGQLLPQIYPRFAELPYRIANEETAVKAALNNNTTNADLQGLGVYKADATLNDSHPLVSALRGRLPLAEQDQPPINAEALRSEFERPPFGWDGHAVQVGLALLLRASACRLIDSSRTLTDPTDPDVLLLLTKEQRFKNLRVQGVRSDLSIPELQEIRGYLQTMFNIKPSLVAATLNKELGDQLTAVARRAQAVASWAATAQCPLPLEFEAGQSLVAELLNTAVPAVRLPLFREQADRLLRFTELLERLETFQRENAGLYREMRDFFYSMVNAETDLPDVRRFIADWRVLSEERSVTTSARWTELVPVYRAAQQAVTNQITAWQQQARARLSELDGGLVDRVRGAGVPEDHLPEETARLRETLGAVERRLGEPGHSLSEARGLQTALTNAELTVQLAVREMRGRYHHEEPTTRQEIHLQRSDLVPVMQISSPEELRQWLEGLRRRIQEELDQQHVVIIE